MKAYFPSHRLYTYVDPITVKKTAKNAFFTEKSRSSQITGHARSILRFN
jgi:hypothetical protein